MMFELFYVQTLYDYLYYIFLDIISINNDSSGTVLTRKDAFFKDTIYDVKSNLNGNIFKLIIFIIFKYFYSFLIFLNVLY